MGLFIRTVFDKSNRRAKETGKPVIYARDRLRPAPEVEKVSQEDRALEIETRNLEHFLPGDIQ